MGSLIRTTAEGIVDTAGQPVFDIVAQIGFDLGELENAPAADVIIDFSNVVTFDAVVAYVERTGAALVSGTTGYTPEQMDRLRELGQNARVMHSGNYSIGIAALRHLVAQATRELPGFDCEIVETHHNQKVDAPSGTAKLLLDAVVEAEPEAGYHPVYGREGMCGARDPKEIGMHSLRGGTVAGVHEVSFFGQDEEVTLTHRATSRQIFVNQAGTVAVGQALLDACLDISGGEGQFAILSATSQAANQNAWIDAMKKIMEEDDKYSKLELVEVAYGDDEPQKSTDQTAALLEKYPDLKVICAPTTVGIAAAAKYLQDNESACKLTGLGLPSEMLEYTGADDEHSCPYFYLWDMQGLGKLSALTTIALVNEDITGALDETFTAGDLGDYTVTDADDGGTEVVLGAPLKFDTSNIEEMAKLY